MLTRILSNHQIQCLKSMTISIKCSCQTGTSFSVISPKTYKSICPFIVCSTTDHLLTSSKSRWNKDKTWNTIVSSGDTLKFWPIQKLRASSTNSSKSIPSKRLCGSHAKPSTRGRRYQGVTSSSSITSMTLIGTTRIKKHMNLTPSSRLTSQNRSKSIVTGLII